MPRFAKSTGFFGKKSAKGMFVKAIKRNTK